MLTPAHVLVLLPLLTTAQQPLLTPRPVLHKPRSVADSSACAPSSQACNGYCIPLSGSCCADSGYCEPGYRCAAATTPTAAPSSPNAKFDADAHGAADGPASTCCPPQGCADTQPPPTGLTTLTTYVPTDILETETGGSGGASGKQTLVSSSYLTTETLGLISGTRTTSLESSTTADTTASPSSGTSEMATATATGSASATATAKGDARRELGAGGLWALGLLGVGML